MDSTWYYGGGIRMTKAVFQLLASEKNQQDGSIRYVPLYVLSPANIESCDISTESYEEKVEYGPEPDIIPLGVNTCGAVINGSFEHSFPLDHPTHPLSKEITDFENTIKIFTEIEVGGRKVSQTYALRLLKKNEGGQGGCRELEGGIWKIKSFNWDRKAKEMGKYRFNIELSYFWEFPAEQKLYDVDTATKKEQTCLFSVDVYKTIHDQANLEGSEIFNTKIHKSLLLKNTATFDHRTPIAKDSIIIIHKRTAVHENDRNIFFGVVSDCESNSRDGVYTVECKEIGDLLYRGVCSQGGPLGWLFPRVVINTPDDNKNDYTIARMVRELLETYYSSKEEFSMFEPGIGIDRTGGLGNSEFIPGRGDPTDRSTWVKLATQVISSASVGTALTNFLYHQCGLYTWFNYHKHGAFEYGYLRDPILLDIRKEVIETTTLVSSNKDEYADGVMVWSADGQWAGAAGDDPGPDKHILVYTYTDTKVDQALEAIAYRILKLTQTQKAEVFNVRFPAGTVRFKEGDYFKGLGDSTMSGNKKMEYRSGEEADPLDDPSDSAWQIKELTITETYTEVQVGTSYYSILDIYKTVLQRNRDGVPAPTERKVIRCNPVEVGGNVTS